MKKESFWDKAATRSVLASLVAILTGMVAGGLIILIVGLTNPTLGIKGAWEGIRLVVAGLFSTGRGSAGELTFGFNPTSFGNMLFRAMPLVMTGLSVALGNKAGLFNIGAPGQFLAGTAASLYVALSVPTSGMPCASGSSSLLSVMTIARFLPVTMRILPSFSRRCR